MANIFQKIGSAFGQYGMDNRMPADQFLNLPKGDRRKMQVEGLQKFSEAMNLIGARQSGNPQRVEQAQNTIRQRMLDEEDAKRKAEQDKLIASMSPEQQKIYKTFGPTAAFNYQQQQLAAEAAGLEELRKIKGLENAGFSEREINLFTNAGMEAKDILALRDQGSNKKTIEQLDAEVLDSKENVSDGLKNLDAAFGVVDTVKGAAAKYLGPVSPIQIAPITTSANAARNTLNERVREKFLSEYSGRPSVYLNVRIDALLPQGSYLTELEAKQKYQEVRRVLKEGLAEMESKIQSNVYKEDELIEVQEQYKDIQSVVKDLDVGINALSKNSSETSSNEKSFGSYDSFYTGG